jgi:hypothetical protein
VQYGEGAAASTAAATEAADEEGEKELVIAAALVMAVEEEVDDGIRRSAGEAAAEDASEDALDDVADIIGDSGCSVSLRMLKDEEGGTTASIDRGGVDVCVTLLLECGAARSSDGARSNSRVS